jgi:hypothetical protein
LTLNQWAIKWGVPFEAVEDLRREFGSLDFPTSPLHPKSDLSEAAVQTNVRLEGSNKGLRLWRNNVGAGTLMDGGFMRWGLCNESKQMNKEIKSSDLIGIRPIRITEHHIGQLIGQFVARETKPGYWSFVGNDHENAQLKFLEIVMSLGGDAAFANKEGTL